MLNKSFVGVINTSVDEMDAAVEVTEIITLADLTGCVHPSRSPTHTTEAHACV